MSFKEPETRPIRKEVQSKTINNTLTSSTSSLKLGPPIKLVKSPRSPLSVIQKKSNLNLSPTPNPILISSKNSPTFKESKPIWDERFIYNTPLKEKHDNSIQQNPKENQKDSIQSTPKSNQKDSVKVTPHPRFLKEGSTINQLRGCENNGINHKTMVSKFMNEVSPNPKKLLKNDKTNGIIIHDENNPMKSNEITMNKNKYEVVKSHSMKKKDKLDTPLKDFVSDDSGNVSPLSASIDHLKLTNLFENQKIQIQEMQVELNARSLRINELEKRLQEMSL